VFDYVAGKADWIAYGLPAEGDDAQGQFVGERLEMQPQTCRVTDPVATVREKVRQSSARLCAVLNEERVVLGLCEEAESLPDSPELTAQDVMNPGPTTLRPSYSVDDALELLRKSGKRAILVTSSNGKLMGVFSGGPS
jgi:CBS domain-containing protein